MIPEAAAAPPSRPLVKPHKARARLPFGAAAASLLAALCLGMAVPVAALEIITTPFAAPLPAPAGTDIVFDAEATGDSVGYAWDFGDGSAPRGFAAEARAVHRYAAPGRYTVVARVRDASAQKTFTFFALAHAPLAALRPASAASIAVDRSRGRVWTVNPDHGTAACLDAASLVRLFEVPVGAGPRTLALAPDGTVWVANHDDATLSILSPVDGARVAMLKLPFGSGPHGIAFAPDGKNGYVTLESAGRILRLDPAARAVAGEAVLDPTARGLAVAGDGRVVATRFLSRASHGTVYAAPASLATVDRIRAAEDSLTADAENRGRGSPNHLAAAALSPDGRYAWIPAKQDNLRRGLARDGLPSSFENTVRTLVMRVDLEQGREAEGLRLDVDDSEGASAVAFGPWGFPAFIAFEGTDKVVAWDPWGEARVMTLDRVGAAPRGLAVDSATGRLFVQAYLDRSVSVYDVRDLVAGRSTGATLLKVIRTADGEALTEKVLLGKRVFHGAADPRMSRDGYLSCASCHAEGGGDGRVWDFTDRGEGLRKTQVLRGRTGYGPLHGSANFDEVQDFEHDIRGAFGGRGFLTDGEFLKEGRDRPLGAPKAGLSPELDALAAYLLSLDKAPPSPYRGADGSLTPDALAGRALFNRPDVGCAQCHVPPLYTDSRFPAPEAYPAAASGNRNRAGNRTGNRGDTLTAEGFLLHDVGTLTAASGKRLGAPLPGLDTPGLKGAWAAAPYLHDGRAPTLASVIGEHNPGDRHGRTGHLSGAERGQLAAFLLQLDDLDDQGAAALRGPGTAARGMRLTLAPVGDGKAWRVELAGVGPRMVTLGIHDLAGRSLGGARLQARGGDGRAAWTWDPGRGRGAADQGTLFLRACAGPDCLGRRLAR